MKKKTAAFVFAGLFVCSAHAEQLVEGVRCGNLKLGMSESDAVEQIGTPQKSWIVWEDKQLDCLVINGKVKEIRINRGSTATFENGIGMDSSLKDIKSVYGEPQVTHPQPNVEKWTYPEKGVLFWILDGKTINQIVLFTAETEDQLQLTGA